MFRELAIARQRREHEHNRDAWVVWHAAYLQRVKKMPPLEQLLATRRTQTAQAHRSALVMLSQQFGIPLRPRQKSKGPKRRG